MKYYKCWKCGESITEGEDIPEGLICTLPFPGRAVCAGAYIEITKEKYDKKVAEWERLKNKE